MGQLAEHRADRRLEIWMLWVGIALIVVLLAAGQLPALAAIAAVVVLTWLAYVAPAWTFVLGLLIYAVPLSLQATNFVSPDIGALYAGIRPLDIVLVGMLGATIVRALRTWREVPPLAGSILASGAVLWAVFVVEVARNLGVYGISAPGEFRSRFLLLIVPAFIALSITSKLQRRFVARWIFYLSVPYVLLVTPLIGVVKGWGIGPDSRFFPAATALGIVYGLIWMFVSRGEGVESYPIALELILLAPCLGLLFADSHRSVWLAGTTALLVLTLSGEIRLARSWTWIWAGVLFMLGIVFLVGAATGVSPLEYVSTRLRAFTDPLSDQTTAWRLYVWEAQLQTIRVHPIVGQGFGGYFDAYIPELDQRTDIFPHSLYVLTAVKVGFIGLAVMITAGYRMFAALRARLRTAFRPGEDRVYLLMGLVALVSLATFGVAYAWDFLSLAWIGVGLSVCFGVAMPASDDVAAAADPELG
jgi:O-antigen ligase